MCRLNSDTTFNKLSIVFKSLKMLCLDNNNFFSVDTIRWKAKIDYNLNYSNRQVSKILSALRKQKRIIVDDETKNNNFFYKVLR